MVAEWWRRGTKTIGGRILAGAGSERRGEAGRARAGNQNQNKNEIEMQIKTIRDEKT